MWENSKQVIADQQARRNSPEYKAKQKERNERIDALLERNERDLNLQLKAATDTPEFKNWFKDSKVVDKNGDPLIVYHGTQAGIFTEFSQQYNDNKRPGFFFTNDEEVARSYSGTRRMIGDEYNFRNIYEVDKFLEGTDFDAYEEDGKYILEKIEFRGPVYEYDTLEAINKAIPELVEQPINYEVFLNIQNPYIIDTNETTWDDIDGKTTNDWVSEVASTNEYDGIIFRNLHDSSTEWQAQESSDVYVVFNPTQIKSIYNNGMFSEYDPNINYQLKESINNVDHYELKYGSSIYNNFIKDGIETNVVYKSEEQNGLSTLLVDMAVEDKEIHDMVIRDTVLGGYDYLKMADNEPTLITNQMIEEAMTQGQPIFQLKEEPQTNGNLLAMHNIDKNKLKNAIKLGGFPMPSIAVAKKDLQYTDFGNITLLFDKDAIDPQASKLNKVYSGDAYTPVFPTVYNKINEDVARKLNNMVSVN